MSIDDRFHAKYVVNANLCWVWQASKLKSGYGLFTDYNRKTVTAHRWSYERFKGTIPVGLVIDHLCRNTSCVNPDHLEAVTQSVNIRRSPLNKNRTLKTHCKNGHEYTPENTRRLPTQRGRICIACKANSKK
jgi:hypothetical protein